MFTNLRYINETIIFAVTSCSCNYWI